MKINARFKKIVSHFELSNKQMAEKLEISSAVVSYILSGRNKVSLDIVQKIVSIYPDISLDWLVAGEGSMFKEEDSKQKNDKVSMEIITELQILQNMNERAMKDIIKRLKDTI